MSSEQKIVAKVDTDPLLYCLSSSISAVSWSLSGEYVVSVDKSRWAVLWSDIWNKLYLRRLCCHTTHLKTYIADRGSILDFLKLFVGQTKGTCCMLLFLPHLGIIGTLLMSTMSFLYWIFKWTKGKLLRKLGTFMIWECVLKNSLKQRQRKMHFLESWVKDNKKP